MADFFSTIGLGGPIKYPLSSPMDPYLLDWTFYIVVIVLHA